MSGPDINAIIGAAAHAIHAHLTTERPRIAVLLGSGLGAVADAITDPTVLDYRDLPGFPVPSVQGHQGQLFLGRLDGVPVTVLQGRVHYYESGDARAMWTPIRALRAAGCEMLLMTNAAGSLREQAGPGSLVLINDHINLTGTNPLIGQAGTGMGEPTPFVDMTAAYDPAMRREMLAAAARLGIDLHEGIYACFPGPSFETPAEIRACATLGADIVGMSLVPETILARHCGLRVAALSVITNYAAGMSEEPLSHAQTMEHAARATTDVIKLVCEFIARVGRPSAQRRG